MCGVPMRDDEDKVEDLWRGRLDLASGMAVIVKTWFGGMVWFGVEDDGVEVRRLRSRASSLRRMERSMRGGFWTGA